MKNEIKIHWKNIVNIANKTSSNQDGISGLVLTRFCTGTTPLLSILC